jgi:FkbM family methyltransferase
VVKKLVLGLVLGCAVLGAAVWFIPQVRMAALVATGRSGACDLSHALAIQSHFKEEMAVKDRILAASKKLQTDGEFEQWETPHGTFWIPVGSKFVLPFNLAEQVLQIYGTGEQAVRAGDVVLDGGANIGVFVKFALNAGAKTVVAIEPGPENIECLRRNFAKEIAEGRVIVYPKGIWDKEEMLTLRVDPTNSAADSVVLQTSTQTKSVQVPLTTIDKMVAELNLPKVDYIKFDIEGAEPNALRGGDQTIRKYKPRLSVSAYHAADHATVIPNLVQGFGAGYKMECGPCNESRQEFLVRPEILYFR